MLIILMGIPKMTGGSDRPSENFHDPVQNKLERVNKTKFLHVIIDENLSLKYHIDGITKTISRNIVSRKPENQPFCPIS